MSLTGISANRLELLQIADAVAREKSIDREIVIEAIEEAIQKGARARYGAEHDIRVKIDQKTGETLVKRYVTVVADDTVYAPTINEDGVEVPAEEPVGIIRLADAKRTDKDAFVGKTYEEILPPFEFGRVQTQMARQVVTGKVREAERERQYEEFKDRVGEIVNGVVKRVSRVQAVVAELQGEKIDIIQWSADEATFIVNALAPAEVSKVVMDEEDERVEVVVPDEQLSLAIGRRGQNVRLASQLTGWQIDIMTESQESERRQREVAERTQLFQEGLDVDEVIAQLLVTEGFATVEDVAYVEADEIAAIEGFDEDTAEEIQARARDYLDREAAEYDAKRRELGVEDSLLEVEGVTLPMAVALGEGEVKTVENLADLVPDDLRGWFETKDGQRVRETGILEAFNLEPADAELLIMRARVVMGWVEAPPEPEFEPEAEGEALEDSEVFAQAEMEGEARDA